MLNTLTKATFKYKNYSVTARPIMDNALEKFFCWQGFLFFEYSPFEGHKIFGGHKIKRSTDYTVAARTIKDFEAKFILLADKLNMANAEPQAEPQATTTTNSLEENSPELDW